MRLFVNEEVWLDLESIRDYIAQDNPAAATDTVLSILDVIEKIPEFPKSGTQLSRKTKQSSNYRFKVQKPYLIFYKIERDAVRVYRVLHGSTDYIKFLDI
ncbi:MAG: type II toxin-antitoxin system RelE/ParE family toxin [Firmicutes bacterium]|nr:type II toxin-antitoxin system RelE/ParE family toxin [Bacillota bacterium]